MTRPGLPLPARPSTPIPPLPHYGGRAPVPAPCIEDAPHYAEEHDARYDAPYAGSSWDDSESYDDYEYDQYEYDEYDDHEFDDQVPTRTNRMAIWGFVLAFVFGPLGLIVSGIGLRQARRRRERGRGLAVAGLVLSVLWLALAAMFGAAVAAGIAEGLESEAAAREQLMDEAAVGTAPAAVAPTTVLEACTTMMPILIAAEQKMTAAQTPEDAIRVLADMRAAVVWAGTAPDPAFLQHLQTFAVDLQTVVDASRSGDVPPGLYDTVFRSSFMVGKDCGLNGWTP